MIPSHHNALHSTTLKVGGLTLEGFSISGLATWLIVHELDAIFDMGECPLQGVPINNVFLTHTHGDHARCLPRHWHLREMFGQKPGNYFVPAYAVQGFRDIASIEAIMERSSESPPNLTPVESDTTHSYKKGLWMQAFSVNHRAPSLGYTIGRTVQKLKPEYTHLLGPEIGALRKSGVEVTDSTDTAVFTFIGDCDGATLIRENHIWESQVVVLECTYVEDADLPLAARNTHTHLQEIVAVLRENPYPNVKALVLKHFSMKYDPARIRELVSQHIPANWADRVHILLPE